jgi:hypothetical protein
VERQLPARRSAYIRTAHEGGVLRCALALGDDAVRHNRSVRRRLKHPEDHHARKRTKAARTLIARLLLGRPAPCRQEAA